jgi:hypothetical protein
VGEVGADTILPCVYKTDSANIFLFFYFIHTWLENPLPMQGTHLTGEGITLAGYQSELQLLIISCAYRLDVAFPVH